MTFKKQKFIFIIFIITGISVYGYGCSQESKKEDEKEEDVKKRTKTIQSAKPYKLLRWLRNAEIITKNAKNVQRKTFTIDNEARSVLFEHPDSEVVFKGRPVGTGVKLMFGIGVDESAWDKPGDGVLFEISIVDEESQNTLLFSKYIDPKNNVEDRRWFDEQIDLSAFEGQKVTFILKTTGGPEDNKVADLAGWSNPQLISSIKGRWRVVKSNVKDRELSDEQQESLRKIATLPYLKGYNPAPEEKNVTYYNEQLAYKGLNFYTSGHAPSAFLMDMKGKILHAWSIQFEDVWSGPLSFYESEIYKTFWRRAHLFDNGDLLAIFEGLGMVKLDKDSNLLWLYKGRSHHDLFVAENGNIYTLTHKERFHHDTLQLNGPILEDFITILSPEGEEIKSVSLLEAFLNSDYASMLANVRWKGNVFHTNTIELLDGRIADKAPMFKQGDVLVSIRRTDTIAIVHLEAEKVTWALSGSWKAQHQPTVLENGNLLLFDNYGTKGKSKVIEFNPLTQEIVWAYKGDSTNEFFSRSCGSNQRLPNGNTLITESDNGRAFEVTPENKIVWEFINPHRAGDDNELIATLFEMIRIGPDQISCSGDSNQGCFDF